MKPLTNDEVGELLHRAGLNKDAIIAIQYCRMEATYQNYVLSDRIKKLPDASKLEESKLILGQTAELLRKKLAEKPKNTP
jgi:hypothetical protein